MPGPWLHEFKHVLHALLHTTLAVLAELDLVGGMIARVLGPAFESLCGHIKTGLGGQVEPLPCWWKPSRPNSPHTQGMAPICTWLSFQPLNPLTTSIMVARAGVLMQQGECLLVPVATSTVIPL